MIHREIWFRGKRKDNDDCPSSVTRGVTPSRQGEGIEAATELEIGAAKEAVRVEIPTVPSYSTLAQARRVSKRRLRLSGDEIARIAEDYTVPYDSYGKLRAYIDTFDRLPPERFLRSAYNIVDYQMRPEDRQQYEAAQAKRANGRGHK